MIAPLHDEKVLTCHLLKVFIHAAIFGCYCPFLYILSTVYTCPRPEIGLNIYVVLQCN